jgi:hypothetical protein
VTECGRVQREPQGERLGGSKTVKTVVGGRYLITLMHTHAQTGGRAGPRALVSLALFHNSSSDHTTTTCIPGSIRPT